MSQEVTDLTDREYYADPYGPLDCDEVDYEVEWADPVWEDDDWDEGDLTEAQYQDHSWDEYDDGVFYNSEDLEDD